MSLHRLADRQIADRSRLESHHTESGVYGIDLNRLRFGLHVVRAMIVERGQVGRHGAPVPGRLE